MNSATTYMLIAVSCFSILELLVKSLPRIPISEIIVFRSLITLIISYTSLKLKKVSVLGNHKNLLILRGIAGSLAFTFLFYSLKTIPLASAVTLHALSPLFSLVLATFILKEKTSWQQWGWFFLAFMGAVLVKGFDPRISTLGFLAGIGSALFAGLAYNFMRKLKNHDDPLVIILYFALVSLPPFGIYAFFNWINPSMWELFLLILVGLVAQIAQVSLAKATHLARLDKVLHFKYLEILLSLVFGFFIFQESLALLSILGIIFIIVGVSLATFPRKSL